MNIVSIKDHYKNGCLLKIYSNKTKIVGTRRSIAFRNISLKYKSLHSMWFNQPMAANNIKSLSKPHSEEYILRQKGVDFSSYAFKTRIYRFSWYKNTIAKKGI